MLNYLAELSLRSKINRENQARQKRFLPWDTIEKIALIISDDAGASKNAIDKFVHETKKYIEVFYVELDSKDASYKDWQCYLKKDRSMLKLPKKALLEELKHKRYDVVINTGGNHELFTTSLASSLHAQLKCGSSARFNDVDLVIEKSEPFNLMHYLENVVKYLKMIRP